jgi:CRP/FNR family transcriptional regulator
LRGEKVTVNDVQPTIVKVSLPMDLTSAYPILLQLPTHLQQQWAREAQPFERPAGQVVFDEDSACGSFLMLTAGTIRVTKSSSNGREILLYRVHPGDACVLTLSCLLGDTVYPARGIAEFGVLGALAPRDLFMACLDGSETFRLYVFRHFSARLLGLMQLVEEVAFGTLDQRLAGLLLSKGTAIKVTHQKLADELGSTREVVSRILEDFAARGALRLERGGIYLLDIEGMHGLAGLCDSRHRRTRRP